MMGEVQGRHVEGVLVPPLLAAVEGDQQAPWQPGPECAIWPSVLLCRVSPHQLGHIER